MEQLEGATVLRPDRVVTGRWTGVGVAVCVLALWIALDASTSLLAWSFLTLCVVVTVFVGAQLVRPARYQLVLDEAAVDVRLPWQKLRVPWDRVAEARVVPVTGEQVLELHLWDAEQPGQSRPRAVGVLLPMGADLDALHTRLERQLGRADAPA